MYGKDHVPENVALPEYVSGVMSALYQKPIGVKLCLASHFTFILHEQSAIHNKSYTKRRFHLAAALTPQVYAMIEIPLCETMRVCKSKQMMEELHEWANRPAAGGASAMRKRNAQVSTLNTFYKRNDCIVNCGRIL